MPLSAPTKVYTSGHVDFSNTTSFTTGTFTPGNNTLLVVFVNVSQQSANYSSYPALTISGGSLSWDAVRVTALGNPSASGQYQQLVGVYTAQVATGALMSITVSGFTNTSVEHYEVDVYSFTGYNTSTPIGATATGTNIGPNSVTITLSGTPASSSYIIAGCAITPQNNGGTTTAGTGWTSPYDNADAFQSIQQQYITGVTSTSVTWNTLIFGDTAYQNCAGEVAVEVLVAGAAETITIDKWFNESLLIRPKHYRKIEVVGY